MVAYENVSSVTFTVGAAVTKNRFLGSGAAGLAAAIAAQGASVIGVGLKSISAADITAGDITVPVAMPGSIVTIEAGAAIDVSSAAKQITTDSVGRAVAVASDDDRVQGWALESAGAAGELIKCLYLPEAGSGAAAAAASHFVFAAGEFTTAGGDTDETILVTDLLATDIVLVTLHTAGSTPVTIVDAAAAAGQIDVDMSADPSTDHVLSYVALRAR